MGRSVFFTQRIWVYCILLAFNLAAYAQSGKITFSGRVVDSETNEPVPSATVRLLSLPDSLLVGGCLTAVNGKFKMTAAMPKGKSAMLHISFLGYSSWKKTIPASVKTTVLNFENISLVPDGFMLDEAVIIGKAPMAVVEEDTTVYNASAYRTPEGAMLEDLVKQLPGGEISSDGKLLINGKEVKKILVDGKEFFDDNPLVAMKNLPVEMIEKLKAYERKSELARLTGVDDGEEEMILDLSVKPGMKKGWREDFLAGIGNKGRYEVANTLKRFRENSQFAIVGNLNNTNNQGFTELQQQSASASGNARERAGLLTSRSLGMNLTREWERVKFRTNIQYSSSDRNDDSRSMVDNFLRKDKSITNSTNNNRTGNDNLVANANLEWKIDSLSTLVFRPQYRYSTSDRKNSGFQESLSNDSLLNDKVSTSETVSSQYNLSFMLIFNRKLSRTGRNIALNLNYGLNNSYSDRRNFSTTHYYKNDTEKVLNQKIDNEVYGYNYRLQLVYVEPFYWNHFLQFRYSYQYKVNNSDRFVYDWDKEVNDFNADCDTVSSNSFENQYTNHLFNFSVRTSNRKYNYNVGVDLEPQKSFSHSFLKDVSKHQFDKSTLNVSPTVNFRYKFSKRNQLQLSYRGRGQQPSIRDLQPVADMTNPLNIRMGNPSLKPSYTNSFSLNYNLYNVKKQRNLTAILSVTNTLNSVTEQVNYDSETGGRTTMPVNMNGNWQASGSFTFNTPLKNRNWMIRTHTTFRASNQNGYTNTNKEDPVKSSVQRYIARENLRLTFRNKYFEATARGDINYSYSYNNVKDKRTETFDYQFGGNLLCYLPWGLELTSDISYYLREGYGYDSNARDNLMWDCQLSKALLKKKMLLLRFKVYDILHQETSLVRTITASSIRDTESNVLGSYFMFHAIFRLNLLGKK